MVMLKEKLKSESGALAKAKAIRTSARKLNLVASSIRGKTASAALTQLRFEKRHMALEVSKVLKAAVANAENNHGLDVDRLYVAEAWVGRAFVIKRFHTRGRGRSAGIEKPFSNLTIIVKQRPEGEQPMKPSRAKGFSKKPDGEKPVAKAKSPKSKAAKSAVKGA